MAEDVSDQVKYASESTPQKAWENITGANIAEMHPDQFAPMSGELKPAIDRAQLPQKASKTVADMMTSSAEHAAALSPDINHFSTIENAFTNFVSKAKAIGGDIKSKVSNRLGPEGEFNDLAWKRTLERTAKVTGIGSGQQYTDDDELRFRVLRDERTDNFGQPDYGLKGFWEKLPGSVAAEIVDLPGMVTRNKEATAVIMGTTTALGAAEGALAGGVGAIPGAIGGAATGALGAWRYDSSADMYKKTTAATLDALDEAVDEKTKLPLNLDENTKVAIAHAVGILGGAATFAGHTVQQKLLPGLNRLMGPSQIAKAVATNVTFRKALIGIGKAAVVGGAENAVQDYIGMVGEELAQTAKGDGSDFSIMNAVINADKKLVGGDVKSRQRLAQSFVTGTAISGIVAGATEAVTHPLNKARTNYVEKPKTDITSTEGLSPEQKAAQAVDFNQTVKLSRKLYEQTQAKQIAPSEAAKLRAKIIENSGVGNVYIDKEVLTEISKGNEVKAAKIRAALDDDGVASAQHNQPIRMPLDKVLSLADEFPEIEDHIKLQPEAPSGDGALKLVDRMKAAEEKRAQLREELLKPGITDEERQAIIDKAKLIDEPINDVHDEKSFLDQPTIETPLEEALPQKEVNAINDADRKAREQVADEIMSDARYERSGVVDVMTDAFLDAERQAQEQRALNNPRAAIVDQFDAGEGFRPTTRYQTPEEAKAAHFDTKEPRSPFAIDPRFLSEEQKAQYAKDPQLKKRKAFVKGGMTPDDAAFALGVRDGNTLLKILSETPSTQELVDQRTEARREDARRNAEKATDLDHSAIAEAFHNKTRNHLHLMEIIKDKDWSAFKKALTRIALPLPKIEEITQQARAAIRATKVKDLNPNQFKVGERRSHRIAVEALKKWDIGRAFEAKHSAALNSELALAAHNAIIRVERVMKSAQKFNTPEVQAELKSAGKRYVDAANEILDVYNFNASKKGQSERGAFQKFVQQQVEAGITNLQIPDRFSDVRESAKEMTVEQLEVAHDRLNSILHLAKMKNELLLKYGPKKLYVDHVINEAVSKLEAHYQYDESKSTNQVAGKNVIAKAEAFVRKFDSWTAMLKNIAHITTRLDEEKLGGYFRDLILAPMQGDGKFANQGNSGKARDMTALAQRFESMIERFNERGQELVQTAQGKDGKFNAVLDKAKLTEWQRLEAEHVDVPEWRTNKILGYGKVSKADLLMLFMRLGNEDGRTSLHENMGTDIDTIESVLARHLDHHHAEFAQNVWNTYRDMMWDRVKNMEQRLTGNVPEMVEPTKFIFKNKVFEGGYFPQMYDGQLKYEDIMERNREIARGIETNDKKIMQDTFRASDMTRHNLPLKRVGSDQPLTLEMNSIAMSFEMMVHDLNFREPIANGLKLLTDKRLAKAITNVVGVQDYNVLVNSFVDASNSVQMNNNALMMSDAAWKRFLARTRSTAAVGHLVGNIASVAKQVESLPLAARRMGYVNAAKHIGAIVWKLRTDPSAMSEMFRAAGEISSSVRAHNEGYDENTRGNIPNVLPVKGDSLTKVAARVAKARVIDAGFVPFSIIDSGMKAIFALGAYRQFMHGDVDGWSYDKVMSLSPEERDHKAKVYASSLLEQSLTSGTMLDKAYVQKKFPTLAEFYNDRRNVFNNILWMGREVNMHLKKGEKTKAALSATASIMTLVLAAEIGKEAVKLPGQIVGAITGNESDDNNTDDGPTWKRVLGDVASQTAGSIPGIADIAYAVQSDQMFGSGRAVPMNVAQQAELTMKNMYEIGMEIMDDPSSIQDIDQKKAKIMLTTASIFGTEHGLPIKGMFEVYDAADHLTERAANSEFVPSMLATFKDRLKGFKAEQAKLPPKDQVDEETMKALEQIEIRLDAPQKAKEAATAIPPGTLDTIKEIESGGDVFAQNPNSSAAGLYQFTEDTWKDIMVQAPELHLTEGGRVSSNTDQQERAMEWFTRENIRKLKSAGIEASIENIYAAHFLGPRKAVEVLKAPGDTKLKSLVSNDVMEANDFRNSMKVRDFKNWLQDRTGNVEQTDGVATVDNKQ